MTDGLKDRVEELVNTTGYPTELYVFEVLRNHEYNSWSNEYFQDFESGKDRSVDLLVPLFMGNILASDVLVRGELIIECKKSPDVAWIFFETKLPVMVEYAGQFVDYKHIHSGDYSSENQVWKKDKELFLHYGKGNRGSEISRNFQVVPANQKDLDGNKIKVKSKDTILEAVSQVTKSIIYTIQTIEKRTLNKWIEGHPDAFFYFAFPIIVYDGLIYNGKLEDGKIKLEERDHVVLETSIRVPYSENPQRFYIDIIKKDKFEDLLKQLENDKQSIINHIDSNKEAFSAEVGLMEKPTRRFQEAHKQ